MPTTSDANNTSARVGGTGDRVSLTTAHASDTSAPNDRRTDAAAAVSATASRHSGTATHPRHRRCRVKADVAWATAAVVPTATTNRFESKTRVNVNTPAAETSTRKM